jgi:hypothetical protein
MCSRAIKWMHHACWKESQGTQCLHCRVRNGTNLRPLTTPVQSKESASSSAPRQHFATAFYITYENARSITWKSPSWCDSMKRSADAGGEEGCEMLSCYSFQHSAALGVSTFALLLRKRPRQFPRTCWEWQAICVHTLAWYGRPFASTLLILSSFS